MNDASEGTVPRSLGQFILQSIEDSKSDPDAGSFPVKMETLYAIGRADGLSDKEIDEILAKRKAELQ